MRDPFRLLSDRALLAVVLVVAAQPAHGLAAFVAVLSNDPDAATRAVLGNALYLGATPGWLVGLLDTEAQLPRITRTT